MLFDDEPEIAENGESSKALPGLIMPAPFNQDFKSTTESEGEYHTATEVDYQPATKRRNLRLSSTATSSEDKGTESSGLWKKVLKVRGWTGNSKQTDGTLFATSTPIAVADNKDTPKDECASRTVIKSKEVLDEEKRDAEDSHEKEDESRAQQGFETNYLGRPQKGLLTSRVRKRKLFSTTDILTEESDNQQVPTLRIPSFDDVYGSENLRQVKKPCGKKIVLKPIQEECAPKIGSRKTAGKAKETTKTNETGKTKEMGKTKETGKKKELGKKKEIGKKAGKAKETTKTNETGKTKEMGKTKETGKKKELGKKKEIGKKEAVKGTAEGLQLDKVTMEQFVSTEPEIQHQEINGKVRRSARKVERKSYKESSMDDLDGSCDLLDVQKKTVVKKPAIKKHVDSLNLPYSKKINWKNTSSQSMNSVSDPYSMDELDTEVDFLNRDHGTSKSRKSYISDLDSVDEEQRDGNVDAELSTIKGTIAKSAVKLVYHSSDEDVRMTDIGGPMTAQGGPISYQCGYMTDRSGPTANGPASCMAGPLADNLELERTRNLLKMVIELTKHAAAHPNTPRSLLVEMLELLDSRNQQQ